MISHKYRYIFIHIPKTAGTSVERCLLNFEGIDRPITLNNLSKKNKEHYHLDHKKNQPHAFFSEIDTHLRETYFSFAFVRNPFDRVVSEYKWCAQFNNVDFLTFLRMPWPGRHSLPQTEFINKDLNFIGKFENLQEDFNVICDKIGIPQKTLPHSNVSKHKHYTEYYNEETKELVTNKYAKDLEYFEYKFGQ